MCMFACLTAKCSSRVGGTNVIDDGADVAMVRNARRGLCSYFFLVFALQVECEHGLARVGGPPPPFGQKFAHLWRAVVLRSFYKQVKVSAIDWSGQQHLPRCSPRRNTR